MHIPSPHKFILPTLLIGWVSVLTFFPVHTVQALAFDPQTGDHTTLIKTSTNAVDLGHVSPTLAVLGIINAGLSLLAALCVGLMIYAGFLWVWARGAEDQIKQAKDIIIGTVIGLVIVLSALGITTFVFTNIANITGATVS